MARALKANFEGLTEVVDKVAALGKSLEDIPTLPEISKMYATVASHLAPVRSGHLRGSIRPAPPKPGKAGAVATSHYAAPINYGHPRRNIKPSLFMNRADPIVAKKLIDLLYQGVDQLISEQGLEP
jgi:hypothetical protein